MSIELIIRGDTAGEIIHAMSGFMRGDRSTASVQASEDDDGSEEEPVNPRTERAKEVEPEATAPKPTRSRGKKADTAKQDTPDTKSTPESSDGATAPTDASPSEVTLDDIRSKASALMDSGKASGKDIQEMLVAKFDARAFGALKPEQYANVIGELENLG